MRTAGTASCWLDGWVSTTDMPGTETDGDQLARMTPVSGTLQRRVENVTLSLAAGATLYVYGVVVIDVPAATVTVRGRDLRARITVIKR